MAMGGADGKEIECFEGGETWGDVVCQWEGRVGGKRWGDVVCEWEGRGGQMGWGEY